MKTNYLKRYIISSYVLVWLLIIFVAGSASLIFHAPPVIMWIIQNIIAWSPTYLLLSSFALTFGISILSLLIYSVITGKSMLSYISMETTALPLSIFLSFTSGSTGEELGWRGFMREEFNKKYNFLKSSVCQGLVWCCWHTLLWVVDSEFTDWRAIPYIISNICLTTKNVKCNTFF